MMKKISNREEANNYYKTINSGVNDFAKETKARPSEIHKYLSRNGKFFLKRLGLDDVSGIENVLNDVLLHRKHIEDDKVINFESFSKLNENILEVGLPTIEHEKVLADLFNTSVGHVESLDSNLHLFKVNDFGKDIYCVIFNKEEMGNIKSNLIEKIKSDILSKVVSLGSIDSVSIDPLKLWISDIVDESTLYERVSSLVSESLILEFVLSSINSSLVYSIEKGRFQNFKEHNSFSVWWT